jgi:hypothetical protein
MVSHQTCGLTSGNAPPRIASMPQNAVRWPRRGPRSCGQPHEPPHVRAEPKRRATTVAVAQCATPGNASTLAREW